MFELSVAFKYLIPRWKQLSVSIISLVSILIIALVVWLIVVFFSVKDGLENSWVDKIIALTAPIRMTPTHKYYTSYYYLVDGISESSNYALKSIGEKLQSKHGKDPYNPEVDEEIPKEWSAKDSQTDGELKDLVQEAKKIILATPSAKNPVVSPFETTMANVRLRLLRHVDGNKEHSQQFLDQVAYIGTFDSESKTLAKALLPPTSADYLNLIQMQAVLSDNLIEDNPDGFHRVEPNELKQRLSDLFQSIDIQSLTLPPQGWRILPSYLPKGASLKVAIIANRIILETAVRDAKLAQDLELESLCNGVGHSQMVKDHPIANDSGSRDCVKLASPTAVSRIIIPQNAKDLKGVLDQLNKNVKTPIAIEGILHVEENLKLLTLENKEIPLLPSAEFILKSITPFNAIIDKDSFLHASRPQDIAFQLKDQIQGYAFNATASLRKFGIGKVVTLNATSLKFLAESSHGTSLNLPENHGFGESILLPKGFKDAGVLIGDLGYIAYHSLTPSSVQEMRVPVSVVGFYDPGIMPIGGKYILALKDLVSMVGGAALSEQVPLSSGLNIRFDNSKDAKKIKKELQDAFEKVGILNYWNIQTYQEYEFSKDLIEQLQSEKNLFSVISLVIIIVACSNIISMLFILVNDKKLEIGILRSMGASSKSIAIIFGFCGMVMGGIGSLIGIFASVLTLHYLNDLVAFIGKMQGHDLFNPMFYGSTLPSELSLEALGFVVITTAFISLIAGVVPATKASAMRPSAILKAE